MSEWIDFKEKEPPKMELILVYFGTMLLSAKESVFMARNFGGKILQEDASEFDKKHKPTHWMSIPLPPFRDLNEKIL